MRRRGRRGGGVEREIAFHLEMRTREFEAEGLSRPEAERAAAAAFGDARAVAAACADIRARRERRTRRRALLAGAWRDVVHAARGILRSPGYALVVLLTLAVGIGANGAMFTVVSDVLLRPLALHEPARLVRVSETNLVQDESGWEVSYPLLEDVRREARTLSGVGAYFLPTVPARFGDEAVQLEVGAFERAVFDVLGIAPRVGRLYGEGEERVVVLSHGLWLRRFGGAPSALGRTFELDGAPHVVVGVMPPEFAFPSPDVEAWLPVGPPQPFMFNRAVHVFDVVARLAPGETTASAAAELARLYEAGQRAEPGSDPQHRVDVGPLRDAVVGDAGRLLWLLLGAVALVLLIACANLAALQLVRGTRRAPELAVRAALGAGRGRLLRPLLIESLLLSGAGCALGVLVALLGVRWFVAHAPGGVPRAPEIGLDAAVVAFMAATALLTAVLAGAWPAWRAVRLPPGAALRTGLARATAGVATTRARAVLVAAEIALSVVLLAAAALTVRTVAAVTSVDPGFRAGGLLTFRLVLPPERYPEPADAVRFFAGLPAAIERVPGVASVGAVNALPVGGGTSRGDLSIEGRPFEPGTSPPVSFRRVTPGYFATMGIPLLAGRAFDADDDADAERVVLVSATLAERFFPDGDAIGRRIGIGPGGPGDMVRIVGIVGDVRNDRLEEVDELATYEPVAQRPRSAMNVVLRTTRPAAEVVPAVRAALRALDPSLLVFDINPMDDRLARAVAPRRFSAQLFGGFGIVALLLAALGVYGLMAFAVADRRREIGVRMALGASRPAVIGLVLRRALAIALAGAVAGVALAFALLRLLEGLLWGVAPTDPATLLAAALTLPIVALMAAALPGLRATRVDPATTLRD